MEENDRRKDRKLGKWEVKEESVYGKEKELDRE